MAKEGTPVTIITGYLGSGKTSLLRHLLAKSTKKLAVIMNEFGEINIDGKIIEGKNVRIAEIAGGCICCSMTGEFELAIKEIIEKYSPEWILLETTGVAEPSAIILDIGENLPEIRIDAIVTMVDCDAMVRFPGLGHTGQEQIKMADVILFNKIDLVDGKQLEKIQKKLLKLNPRAIMAKSINGKVPPVFLFGLEKDQQAKLKKRTSHVPELEVFVFESSGIFNKEKFTQLINNLPKEIYRAKGFIHCKDESYLFNYVAGRFDFKPFKTEKTELVFIGKNILKLEKKIKAKLEKCKTG